MQQGKRILITTLALILTTLVPLRAGETVAQWFSQTLYVPIYSHIFADDRFKGRPFLLTAVLSVRNTDRSSSLVLTQVDYHDSQGKLLKQYLDSPLRLAPLASTHYVVPESEKEGGVGAKFLVQWKTEKEAVTEPVVEAVMIGTKMQQGISFLSNARVIEGQRSAK